MKEKKIKQVLKKIIKRYIPNHYRLSVFIVNFLIFTVAFHILFYSFGGFYYKQSLMPGQKEMMPSIAVLVLLIFVRHLIKLQNKPGIRTDKLTKLLNNKNWVAFILLLVLVFGYYSMFRNSWNMSTDSNLYYVYLRSLFFDGDLHFTNDYMHMGGPVYSMNHQTGYWINPFSVGCSILWFPFFLTGHIYAKAIGLPADGYAEFPYGISINLAGLIFAWIGLILLVSVLQKLFNDKVAVATALVLWFGTPLTFYTNQQPNLDTSVSFFAGSLFLYFVFLLREKATTQRWIGIGISAGTAMLVRPQNVILLIIPAFLVLKLSIKAIKEKNKKSFSQITRGVSLLVLFTAVTFIPQMMTWQIMYNSPLTIPQGKNWMEWNNPKIIQILFSTNHGLFAWTPILLFGFLGILLFFRKDKWASPAMAVAFLAMVYINSVPNDWWGGFAFGGRRFASTFPILGIGMAALLKPLFDKRILRYLAVIVLLCVIIWNISLISIFSDKTIPHQGIMKPEKLFNTTLKRALRIISDIPGSLQSCLFVLTHKDACAVCHDILLTKGETLIKAEKLSPFIRNGWTESKNEASTGKIYRSASRSISSFNFYLSRIPEKDLNVEIACKPAGNTQVLVPVVNFQPIKEVIKFKQGWNNYAFKIKNSYLQKGVNILRFDSFHKNIKKPVMILQGAGGEYFDFEWMKIILTD